MGDSDQLFSQLVDLRDQSGPAAVLDNLISHYESQHRFHELFEALKMRSRLNLGLPPAQMDSNEKLPESVELELERGLIEACRQVGIGLLKNGKIREGWMYMRPVGDKRLAADTLRAIEATDDNIDEFLEVLVHEGVDIARGYELALTRMGTCNSITLFESAIAGRSRADQQTAAGILVRHVHRDLLANLKYDVSRREGTEPGENSLEELLKSRPDLLRDGSYHLDTTHLSSTVRYSRVLDDAEGLTLALDLTAYGRHLHPQFQYPGDEPFLDLYPASAIFFRALLGQGVDAAIRYFSQKADSVDRNQYGTAAIEVLIDLLARVGRTDEALDETAKRMPQDSRPIGIAPSLIQLSHRLGNFQRMQEICRQRHDLLGFTAALLQNAVH